MKENKNLETVIRSLKEQLRDANKKTDLYGREASTAIAIGEGIPSIAGAVILTGYMLGVAGGINFNEGYDFVLPIGATLMGTGLATAIVNFLAINYLERKAKQEQK